MKTKQKRWGVVRYMMSRNSGKQLNLLLLLFISIFLIVGCSNDDEDVDQVSPQIPLTGGKITGTVKDASGNAYPNTSVHVSNGIDSQTGKTGSSGQYSITTKENGPYEVDITPPLSSNVTSALPISVDVSSSASQTANFVIAPQPVDADLIIGNADILSELKNSSGNAPSGSDLIYAANVWDPPFGQLTAVNAPDGHHINLIEWKKADGILNVNCNGNKANVNISLAGLIPGGTYTFWLNFLNKKKKVGEPVDFSNDVALIQPLGASSGTENIAVATGDGSISMSVEHSSCVLTQETGLVLVVIYHINGNTYGPAHIPDTEEISQLLFYFQ